MTCHDEETAAGILIGVGGAGCNIVKALQDRKLTSGLSLVFADTDADKLREMSKFICNNAFHARLLQMGRGVGCGMVARFGRSAAREARTDIEDVMRGAKNVIVVAGLFGGAGRGAAPLIARYARSAGAKVLIVGIEPTTFDWSRHKGNIIGYAKARLTREADETVWISNAAFENDHGSLMDLFHAVDDQVAKVIAGWHSRTCG